MLIRLELESPDPPQGRAVSAAEEVTFAGWLELLQALAQITAREAGPRSPDEQLP